MPVVDVIIPTFNRQMLLKRSLNSVLSQSFEDFLVWVVDDGSTDETMAFLEEVQDPRLRVLKLDPNRGVSAARNAGIRAGSSPFVALLDSDDEWKPKKLEQQLQQLEENPSYALSHTEEIWWRNGAEVRIPTHHKKSGGWIFDRCVEVCCISPSTTLLRRSVLESVGLFREDFVVCEDYELWLRICSQFEIGFLPEPLIVKHGGHDDQLSMKFKAMDYWRVKALMPFLKRDHNPKLVRQMIIKRCEILLAGYEKYNRQGPDVDEVQHWLEQTKIN